MSQPLLHSVSVVLSTEINFMRCGRNFQRPEARTQFGCVCVRRSREGEQSSVFFAGIPPHPSGYALTLPLFCRSRFSASCCLPWLALWGLSPTTCSPSSASTTRGCGFHTPSLKTKSISNRKWEVSKISLIKMWCSGWHPLQGGCAQRCERTSCHGTVPWNVVTTAHVTLCMFHHNKKRRVCVPWSVQYCSQNKKVEAGWIRSIFSKNDWLLLLRKN